MNKRWRKSNKAVFNIGYHLVWCPKYRRRVLTGAIADRLSEILKTIATEMEVEIAYMSVMLDHVHLFVRANPVDSPHWLIKQFKGFSSNILRGEFPELKTRLPTLWTRSYFCESVGHISEDVVRKYIESQGGK